MPRKQQGLRTSRRPLGAPAAGGRHAFPSSLSTLRVGDDRLEFAPVRRHVVSLVPVAAASQGQVPQPLMMVNASQCIATSLYFRKSLSFRNPPVSCDIPRGANRGSQRVARNGGRLRGARARSRARARRAWTSIHLEIGEPDFETPAHVAEAGIAAIRAGQTHYCPTAGLPELREAAAVHLSETRGRRGRPRAGCWSRTGRSRSSSSRSRPPASPATRSSTPTRASRSTPRRSAGPGRRRCRCRCARSAASGSIRPSSRRLLTPRTRLVILNSPQNPTGGVLDAEEVRAAAAAIRTDRRLGADGRGLQPHHLRAAGACRSPPSRGCSSAPSCSTGSRRSSR